MQFREMKLTKRSTLLWIAVGLWMTEPCTAQRAIRDNNLAYPVHVSVGDSTGSGFFVSKSDGVYFVTARHVLIDLQTHQPIAQQVRNYLIFFYLTHQIRDRTFCK